MVAFGAARDRRVSVYLVYVLEILKFKRLDTIRLRRDGRHARTEIDEDVAAAPGDRRVRAGRGARPRSSTPSASD